MGELVAELGVGKRSKRSSARCRDPPVVVQASGLTRVSLPLEQHLPEEQSVIRVDGFDTITSALTRAADITSEPVFYLADQVRSRLSWWGRHLDRRHSSPSPKQRRALSDEGESSEGAGEELAAVVPLTEGGTESPVMTECSADADTLDQEAPASVDAVVLPPNALVDQEK
ncbi:uncharacterized protein A4U43_C04F18250 [Asparagus officinalis]|uniref:Uncharacterized protein n=1 Tax=Asparagus officinalis TaxID=4686 RepID=A0A5P1F3M9_ASPOF|nr:uncharacterized protein A4U43_C04F18250 [Asparagus officinalis]